MAQKENPGTEKLRVSSGTERPSETFPTGTPSRKVASIGPPLPFVFLRILFNVVGRYLKNRIVGFLTSKKRRKKKKISRNADWVRTALTSAMRSQVNDVSLEEMRQGVKVMETGGGAHKFHDLFSSMLSVEFRREDEMECLIEGLKFITLIP